jgi:hypothetical protein
MSRTYDQARDELVADGYDLKAVNTALGHAAAVFSGDTLGPEQFETVRASLDVKAGES